MRSLRITRQLTIFLLFIFSGSVANITAAEPLEVYHDVPFQQEYHDAYTVGENPAANNVRKIAVDAADNVWIATAAGVFVKENNQRDWQPVFTGENRGPAYTVVVDSTNAVWLGTWNGVYRVQNQKLTRIKGVDQPVSVLCFSDLGLLAGGPYGSWKLAGNRFQKNDYPLARSFRDAVAASGGGVWLATDVGLYHLTQEKVRHYLDENELISGYLRGLAFDFTDQLWVGGLGGVTVRNAYGKIKTLTPKQGIPSAFVNTVRRAPDSSMWVGTDVGIVRFYPDGSRSVRFTRRWLLDDQVNDIAFDSQGNAWVATSGGVSAIRQKTMKLAQKADYFYQMFMRRHIRDPWIPGACRLPVPGDTSVWEPLDTDNDGIRTAEYLAMESLRFAVTGKKDAQEKARKAFDVLKLFQEITETDGFFARTIIPADWKRMADANRTYSDRQLADEMVKNPRFKKVENRWRKSSDGKWLWKGDTSSDEMTGHFMGYFFYYELVADESEKQRVRAHVSKIMDYLMKHDYTFVDIDGKHTKWGVWSPDKLNRDPEWRPERGMNSLEMLAFLKFTYYITGNEKYQKAYLYLIQEEGYLENIDQMQHQNPAWVTYIDANHSSRVYPLLLRCETDPKLKQRYEAYMDAWFYDFRQADRIPFYNFSYCFSRNKKAGVAAAVDYLKAMPLEQVVWRVDLTRREDLNFVRKPVLETIQVDRYLPPDERPQNRSKPFKAIGGVNGYRELKPGFTWLLPYWLGRYIGAID